MRRGRATNLSFLIGEGAGYNTFLKKDPANTTHLLKKDKIKKCSPMLLRIAWSFDVLLIWSDWTKCRRRVRL